MENRLSLLWPTAYANRCLTRPWGAQVSWHDAFEASAEVPQKYLSCRRGDKQNPPFSRLYDKRLISSGFLCGGDRVIKNVLVHLHLLLAGMFWVLWLPGLVHPGICQPLIGSLAWIKTSHCCMHTAKAASLYTGGWWCNLLVYRTMFANIGGLGAVGMLWIAN